MKKPKNMNEFIELINSMNHRERFVFDCLDFQVLEIYSTTLFESRASDTNIKITLIDQSGKQKSQNRLLRLFTDKNFNQLFNLIK
jgi:hypothetical protein